MRRARSRHNGLRRFATAALVASGAAFLAACTTTTPYQPSLKNRPGFTDQRLENTKFRITFEGNSSTNLAVIENYVLYRAAEVTLANGHDYFAIVDQSRESESRFNTTGTTFGGAGFGRSGFFYGGGFGGGFGTTQSTTRERRAYTVGVVIEVFKGDKPSGNASAYDARQVIDNLRPTLVLPKAKG